MQDAQAQPQAQEVTPRQMQSMPLHEVEDSLMMTPSASERKSMLNSLLSDDEQSAASTFEPLRASNIS